MIGHKIKNMGVRKNIPLKIAKMIVLAFCFFFMLRTRKKMARANKMAGTAMYRRIHVRREPLAT